MEDCEVLAGIKYTFFFILFIKDSILHYFHKSTVLVGADYLYL